MAEIGDLIRENSKGEMNWKTFSIFLVGVMVCTLTINENYSTLPMKAGGMIPLFGKNRLRK